LLRANPLVGGKLLFTADDGEHGEELWKSNGAPSGTVLLKDIGSAQGDSNPEDFVSLGGELYFTAVDDTGQRTQWTTDGTPEGTVETDALPVAQAGEYFAFDDGVHGLEL